jgi:hypothetical protein
VALSLTAFESEGARGPFLADHRGVYKRTLRYILFSLHPPTLHPPPRPHRPLPSPWRRSFSRSLSFSQPPMRRQERRRERYIYIYIYRERERERERERDRDEWASEQDETRGKLISNKLLVFDTVIYSFLPHSFLFYLSLPLPLFLSFVPSLAAG